VNIYIYIYIYILIIQMYLVGQTENFMMCMCVHQEPWGGSSLMCAIKRPLRGALRRVT
jgi:hypothetical protein